MLRLLSIIVVSMFAITLITAYFAPIYPDEIAARIWLSRLIYDFPQRINLYPTCISAFSQPVPITWLVPSLIEWVIHGNIENLKILRLVGVISAIFFITLLTLALPISVFEDTPNRDKLNHKKINAFLRKRFHSSVFVISLLSIGVLPIFLVTNRQEQLILPAIILLVCIFNASNRANITFWKTMILVTSYFLTLSIILYTHPKGLFLTPFIALVGFKLFQKIKNHGLRLLGAGIVITHIIIAYLTWKHSFQCQESPQLAAILLSFSLDPATLLSDPHYFFNQAYQSAARFFTYPLQLGFKSYTDINYLPPITPSLLAKIANIFIWLNFIIAFFSILVLLPFNYYRKDIAHGRFITTNVLLIALLACAVVSAVFNLPKNWYDAGYFYVLLMVIWIFFLSDNLTNALHKTVTRRVFIYLICVAILSQAVFIQRNLPAFLAGYAGPSISLVNYDHSQMLKNLAVASRSCDIDPVLSKGVIVDDYTYPYFQKSKHPMAITYIFLGKDPTSVSQFISEVNSAGLVTRCTSLPESYATLAKKTEGGLCCISKNVLNHFP
jgi:hypothetical protein